MKKRKSQELSGAKENKKRIALSSLQSSVKQPGNKFKRKLQKEKPAVKNRHNVLQKRQTEPDSHGSSDDGSDGVDEYEDRTGAGGKNLEKMDTTDRTEMDESSSDESGDDVKDKCNDSNIASSQQISGEKIKKPSKRKAVDSKSKALDSRTSYEHENDSHSEDDSDNVHERSGQTERQQKSGERTALVGNEKGGLDSKDQDMDSDGSDDTDSDEEEVEKIASVEKTTPGGVKETEEQSPKASVIESEMQNGDVSQDKDGGQEGGTDAMSRDDAQKYTNAILTKTTFSSLKDSVCEETLRGISDMGFSYMTEIQDKTLPHLLEGRDLLAAAKTGSGKTLAFLIPAIELIHKLKFMPRNGTGVIIISPTRELCMQIYGVLKEVMVHHYHTYGIVMGGTNRATEMKKLAKGVNILVATPGRLLDHMQKTPQFLFKNLQCLVIDEADRILDIGFEEDMKQIVKLLPKKRQTMLFSATQTRKTEDLARISLKKQPIYIGVDDEKTVATVNGLEQGYVFCPSEKRFLLLFTFLKKNRSKKVMVFMSSCKSVKYHAELLNYIDLPVACIHGRKKQANRTTTFFQFCQAKQGILICTDVAARGLDIPAVDWIVQFDPPDDPKEYIHRVGRTARGLHGKGHALLILRPEEAGFLRYLKHAKVPISEYDFSWAKVANIQIQLEKLVEKNYFLHVSAKEAYKGYIRSYQSHSLKKIFRLESLDLNLVAKSFGFRVPPSVDLIVPTRKKSAGRDKGHQYNPKQRNFKKAQKSKIFRHVDSKRDRKDMRSVLTH